MMNQAYGGLAQGIGGLFTGVEQGLEERRERKKMEAFQQMTPIQQADYMAANAKTPKEVLAAQELGRSVEQREGNSAVQPLLTELSDPETSNERAKEIREELFSTARSYNIDEAKVRDAYKQANERRILSEVEQFEAETREFSIRAKQALASNTSREAFVSQYGDEAGAVYDAEKEAQDLRAMQIEQARENLRKSKYQYSDKILSSPPFSFSQAERDQVDAISGGAAKNAMVLSIVTARVAPQNAALITVYAKAMYNQVAEEKGLDLDDEDERPIIESEAYRRVLLAYSREGLKGIAGMVAQKQEKEESTDSTTPIDFEAAIQELFGDLENQPE
jgi:hypothetical protein